MRRFNSLSLVTLPRVDVLGSLTLSAQLITTAEAAVTCATDQGHARERGVVAGAGGWV